MHFFSCACVTDHHVLIQVLANALVGGTAQGEDSEDVQQENSSESASNQPNKSGEATNYVVIGTTTGSDIAKPDWVEEIIDVSDSYKASWLEELKN